ncbi:MAG: HD-GYP domain-containing protein [Bacillota bacterium]
MRLIPINAVKEGAFLAQTLYNDNGQVLLSKGVKINERLKAKIKEQGFYSIYIFDDYSQDELEDIIKPEIRRKAIQSVRTVLNALPRLENDDVNTFQKKKIENEVNRHLEDIQDLAKLIVNDVFSQRDVMISLVDIKNTDNYTYMHSVNTSILALVLGIGYGLNKNELYELTLGAMLHDIGKMYIPGEILNKDGPLTDEEFKIIQQHPLRGFNYLKDRTELSGKVRIIALQHHEKMDGTGYPYGLKDDQIYILSKMTSIADIYDAITSDRPYRKSMPPNEAVEFIMGSAGRYFTIDLVKAFIKKIVPYPVGTIVRLSNNCIGVIENINQEFILRPVIKIIKEQEKEVSPYLCNLMRESNVIIQGIVYNV